MASASLDPTPAATKRKRSKFPQSFWVANTMEIFERLAWYGFFAVSSLYITGSRAEGALGFTSEQRGLLQGIVPFILYLLPVVFGALGDRFGYKKTFMVAYATLVPAYYLLGQFTQFGTFFMAFLFVAVGAAIFKPVVVGTVARTTDETNSSMGFGIFYMMVNIGGFVGPIVAGIVRVKYGWNWVFVASSFWIACNFLWLFLFYKEPTTEATRQRRSLRQVFGGIVEVLGNGRFFLMVFGILIMLMIVPRLWGWNVTGIVAAVWIFGNLLIDIPLRARERAGGAKHSGMAAPMRVGNWKFALYLLILSGFWTSFNQIFLTHPEFIRDFVDTRDMVNTAEKWFGPGFARSLAAVNEELLADELGRITSQERSTVGARIADANGGRLPATPAVGDTVTPIAPVRPAVQVVQADSAKLRAIVWELYNFKVRVPPQEMRQRLNSLPAQGLNITQAQVTPLAQELQGKASDSKWVSEALNNFVKTVAPPSKPNAAPPVAPALLDTITAALKANPTLAEPAKLSYVLGGLAVVPRPALETQSHELAEQYRQVNPEYIINVDAGAIVVFQVLVSWLIGFVAPLSALIIGVIIAAIGIGMAAWTYGGWLVTLAITIFAFGEMAASPKSQEYVGRIAPADKVAMYMGFYFWCVALGNIFGGLLSGELYGSLARDAGRPDIMWMIFGALGLITAVVLFLYDRLIIGKGEMK